MAAAKWIDGAEDMLDDFRGVDESNRGKVTPMLRSSILRLAGRGLSSDWIAEQLAVDSVDVEEVMKSYRREPK